MSMPTYQRRFFIETLRQENQKQREHMDNMKNNGKGTRSRTISGEALKDAMKRGDIPAT